MPAATTDAPQLRIHPRQQFTRGQWIAPLHAVEDLVTPLLARILLAMTWRVEPAQACPGVPAC
jgi:hypothetical protein